MKKELLPADREELLSELKTRFEKNMDRHKGLEWANSPVEAGSRPSKTVVTQRNGPDRW